MPSGGGFDGRPDGAFDPDISQSVEENERILFLNEPQKPRSEEQV
jgi:hypothetical protein